MKPFQRLSVYLLLNVLVSAITTLLVLVVWTYTHPGSKIQASAPENSTPSAPETTLTATMPVILTPENTPTPTEIENVEEYEIQRDDTLGEIASRYGLSVEEIMQVNGLNDPDSISAGMVIYIPVTPEIPPTNTPAPTATAALALDTTPDKQAGAAGVVINSVIGVGDLTQERVFISRTGPGELNMAGWQLRDEHGNAFAFPQLQLFEGGAINVWTTSGSASVVDLYWGLQSSIWQAGETVTLIDAQGAMRATYQIP
ncbi:MAG: LysM peptidoglycan-binding domain-containing protein [Anaerolineales bacterium]|nr:LysM peptidoglycan-binding domain-containing protein [Anaerolineales bacterium]